MSRPHLGLDPVEVLTDDHDDFTGEFGLSFMDHCAVEAMKVLMRGTYHNAADIADQAYEMAAAMSKTRPARTGWERFPDAAKRGL